MARSLNLRVVAEGVETTEELTFLRGQDCDEAQGYYFSRPVTPDAFAILLETGIPDRAGSRLPRIVPRAAALGDFADAASGV